MAPSTIAWKAVEHRVTPPFPTCDRSLENVKFRLDPNEEPTAEEERRIESAQDWDGLTPELFMEADATALSDDTGVPAESRMRWGLRDSAWVCGTSTLARVRRSMGSWKPWTLFGVAESRAWPMSSARPRRR